MITKGKIKKHFNRELFISAHKETVKLIFNSLLSFNVKKVSLDVNLSIVQLIKLCLLQSVGKITFKTSIAERFSR